jgi:hypothetical protein
MTKAAFVLVWIALIIAYAWHVSPTEIMICWDNSLKIGLSAENCIVEK